MQNGNNFFEAHRGRGPGFGIGVDFLGSIFLSIPTPNRHFGSGSSGLGFHLGIYPAFSANLNGQPLLDATQEVV